MVSEKRFKVDYEVGVLDTKTNEIVCDTVNAKEVVDLLNEQQATIKQQEKIIKEQTLRTYCQDKEIQKLLQQIKELKET